MPIPAPGLFRMIAIDFILGEAERVGFNLVPLSELRRRLESVSDELLEELVHRWVNR